MIIFDLNTRDPFCLILTIEKFEALASVAAGHGSGTRRWTSVLCASTPGCTLDPVGYAQFLERMKGLISAYRALCADFDRRAIAAVLDAMVREICGEVERCVSLDEVDCLCPRVRRLDRARSLAHILIDIAWARGPTIPGTEVVVRNLQNLAFVTTDLSEHLALADGGLRRFAEDDPSPAAGADRLAVDLFDTIEQLSIAMKKEDA